MMVKSLDHVQLAMPPGGESRAREFYHGVLDIPEVPKPAELAKRGGCNRMELMEPLSIESR